MKTVRQLLAIGLSILLLSACDRSTATDNAVPKAAPTGPDRVSALGRLQPKNGVLRISSPSVPDAISGAIVTKLLVDVGDDVIAGQLLAVTDTAQVLAAKVQETRTQLALTEQQAVAARSSAHAACVRAGVLLREADRLTRLLERDLAAVEITDRARGSAQASEADCSAAESDTDVAKFRIEVARARVRRQQFELERAHIRAPVDSRILAIAVRPGEQIGLEGVLDLGRVDSMYAIAEVYETDVSRLRIGQEAVVRSPALAQPLTGHIDLIHPLVNKQDALDTDPAARKDARIVEVEVILDSPESAADLTYLQVDVIFEP